MALSDEQHSKFSKAVAAGSDPHDRNAVIEAIQEKEIKAPEIRVRSSTSFATLFSCHSRSIYWVVAIAVVVLWTVYDRTQGTTGFPLDDGYISLHSAQVMHWGKDPNFPNVAPLAGITNAPYVLLLYVLLFFLAPLTALHVASWLGVLCYSLGLVALGRAFRLPWIVTLGLAALGLAVGRTSYQLLNGVETGFAMSVVAWIFALVKANTIWSRRIAALLCGLAPFLRPELVALSALVLVSIGWKFVDEEKQFLLAWRPCLPLLLLAALAAAPWLIWYGVSTGTMIPQSVEAKRVFYAEGCASAAYRWAITLIGLRVFLTGLGLLTLSLVFLVRNIFGRFVLIFVPLFFFAYFHSLPGGIIFCQSRYAYILMPVFLLGLGCGLGDRSWWVRRAAYVLLGLCSIQATFQLPETWTQFRHDRDFLTHSLDSVAGWSNSNLPPNATVLIHDAGYISYATKFRLVDFVGLKTPGAIDVNRRLTYATCGGERGQAVSEIAHLSKPNYLIVADDWDRGLGVTTGLRALRWNIEEVGPRGYYHVFRITPAE